MLRLLTVIAACCVPALPLAAETTVTSDTYQPEPAASDLAHLEIELAALGAASEPMSEAHAIEALLHTGAPEFSPRAQLVVRAAPAPAGGVGASGVVAVPAPTAMVLLGLGGLVASRRQRQPSMGR